MVVLLERPEGDAVRREIYLIAALSLEALNQELNQAASEGYRLVPGGVLRNPSLSSKGGDSIGQEGVLLLERSPQVTERLEYLVSTVPGSCRSPSVVPPNTGVTDARLSVPLPGPLWRDPQ